MFAPRGPVHRAFNTGRSDSNGGFQAASRPIYKGGERSSPSVTHEVGEASPENEREEISALFNLQTAGAEASGRRCRARGRRCIAGCGFGIIRTFKERFAAAQQAS